MIRRAWFEEFRALRKVSVDLERLTVLVGPNSSGKTSVLEGIHRVLSEGWQSNRSSDFDSWLNSRPRNTRAAGAMKIGVGFDSPSDASLELTVTSSALDEDPSIPHATMLAATGAHTASWTQGLDTLKQQGAEFEALRRAANGAFLLRLSARSLAEASYAEVEEPEVGPDGSGLATVLDDLAGNQPDRKEAITKALRDVVPSVRRIRTERAPVLRRETEFITIGAEQVPRHRDVRYWGSRVLLDTTSGDSIPLHAASEGTVLTLGLMTLLYGRRRPRTLLMDDLDRALHPRAQEELVGVLRSVMQADPDLQIVATSHSPFLLNALEFEEVRLTTLADDGSVRCGALRDHPAFAQWKGLVKPGELWTSELEDWLRNASPATPA